MTEDSLLHRKPANTEEDKLGRKVPVRAQHHRTERRGRFWVIQLNYPLPSTGDSCNFTAETRTDVLCSKTGKEAFLMQLWFTSILSWAVPLDRELDFILQTWHVFPHHHIEKTTVSLTFLLFLLHIKSPHLSNPNWLQGTRFCLG